ncbi:MFS transporter [Actinomadura sp. HBU206391]|uniref:MFS transporter n=1 Tax=Actinomadura sp. HBU206391 TaxID=2731692 RepID=UPI00164F0646|nr:MFS transporter [Actinomadura sp. HBU206391]MBC6457555.1 MFS transporter [Actinomadura sp. HBU206391]
MTSPEPRRWWALSALVLSLLVIGFDTTILNVALPTLSSELEAGTTELQWIVDSYILVFAATLLPAGALGDRFGRKRLLLAGMAVFAAASLAGALAEGPGQVIAARSLMGVGGAIITALSMSTLPVIFPPEERSRAIAIWTASVAVGLPLGPIVGGWLLDGFWWGSIFLVNVPIIVAAVIAIAVLLPESRDPEASHVDGVGALLSAAGLVAFVYGVIEAPVDGWSDPVVLLAVGGGLALLALFAGWERRTAHPMMDLRMFGDPVFLWATVAATFVSFMLMGVLFVVPQYLQSVQGNDALGTGLRLLPMMIGLMAGAVVTDRVAPRAGHKAVIVTGLLVLAAGLAWGSRTTVADEYVFTAAWFTIVGLGSGLAMVPAMDALMATFPDGRTGVGSGLVQTIRQVGGALGVAGLGSLLAATYRDRVPVDGLPPAAADSARESVGGATSVALRLGDPGLLRSAQEAYVHGMDRLLVVCALAGLAGAVLTWSFLPGRRADRTRGRDRAGESEYEYAAP